MKDPSSLRLWFSNLFPVVLAALALSVGIWVAIASIQNAGAARDEVAREQRSHRAQEIEAARVGRLAEAAEKNLLTEKLRDKAESKRREEAYNAQLAADLEMKRRRAEEASKITQAAEAEERWRQLSVDSTLVSADSIILITRDSLGGPRWDLGARLEGELSRCGLKAHAHLLTEQFYGGPFQAKLNAGDMSEVLGELRLKGKVKGLILATFTVLGTTSDADTFITADVQLRFVIYNGDGLRRNEMLVKESGAALARDRAIDNALERLWTGTKVKQMFNELRL